MKYRGGLILAFVLFVSCVGWSQLTSDRASVRRIVLRYCELDAEGALIDSGNSTELRKYISDDIAIRQFPMIVIKGFSLESLNVTNDIATVVIDYEFFGQLKDDLAYQPVVDLREKKHGQPATGNLQVEFKLRRAKTGWVITSCGSGVHVNIEKMIAYLKKEKEASAIQTHKHNADEALSMLHASMHP